MKNLLIPIIALLCLSTSNIYAESFLKSDSIIEKEFIDELAEDGSCKIQQRTYLPDYELRTYSKNNSEKCRNEAIETEIQNNSYIMTKYESTTYLPGIPLTQEDMSLGATWDARSALYYDDKATPDDYINFSFEIISNSPVSISAGDFSNCRAVKSYASMESRDITNELIYTYCEDIGLVKFENVTQGNSWQLDNITYQEKNRVVNGSDYIKSNSITQKTFKDNGDKPNLCPTQIKTFSSDENTEYRTYKKSEGAEECHIVKVNNTITESTYTFNGFKLAYENYDFYLEETYTQGIPIIKDAMKIGDRWKHQSVVNNKDGLKADREDTLSILWIEDIETNAGSFSDCIKLYSAAYWSGEFEGGHEKYMWFCPEVGMVKEEFIFNDSMWELESYSHSNEITEIYFGSEYLRPNSITSKTFKSLAANTGCNIETRVYNEDYEAISLSQSKYQPGTSCSEYNIYTETTGTTYIQKREYFPNNYSNRNFEYSPGIKIIPEIMKTGKSWSQTSEVTVDNSEQGTQEDSFTVQGVEDIETPTKTFHNCIKINQVSTKSYNGGGNTETNYWICPLFGIVKYEKLNPENSKPWQQWLLEDFSTQDDDIEEVTVSGKNYIQLNSITSKDFKRVDISDAECDIQKQSFAGSYETRVFRNSITEEQCSTEHYKKTITDSTLTYTAATYEKDDNTDEYIFSPGYTVIEDEMTLGSTWGKFSEITYNGVKLENHRLDNFTLESIEDVHLRFADYKDCLVLKWNTTVTLSSDSSKNSYLWVCPQVGLVKYKQNNEVWLLQSFIDTDSVIETAYGADYIQDESITEKEFLNIKSIDNNCDKRISSYSNNKEYRQYLDSVDLEECYSNLYFYNNTESTLTEIGYETESSEGLQRYDYSPGRPYIISEMKLGIPWTEDITVEKDGAFSNEEKFIMTAIAIEDVDVAAGSFKGCLKTRLDYNYSGYTIYFDYWYCKDIGLVKYQTISDIFTRENVFELQSYTSESSAPTITGDPSLVVNENEQYLFTPITNGIDQEQLIFSIENKPSWAAFDTATGALTGTPDFNQAGTYEGIIITVTDGEDSDSLPAFSITVNNVNRAPTISGTPNTSVLENQAYSFTPEASDLDGDTLTFSITNKPTWASFYAETGALTGTPANKDVGEYIGIIISVSDGEDTVEIHSFNITVLAVDKSTEEDGSGGGSIPLCLIFILGIIAVRRKH